MSEGGVGELVSFASKGRIEAKALTYWIIYLPECVSVINEALEHTRKGALEGTLVIAEEVLGSPKGTLEYALILRPSTTKRISTITKLSMLTSLAKSIEYLAGIKVRVRWASDLIYNDRVIGKVITELPYTPYPSPPPLIIYAKVNVNNEVSPLSSDETSIKELVGPLSRSELLELTIKHFDRLYSEVIRGKFRLVISEVRNYLEVIGKVIRVLTYSEGLVEGVVVDIDYDGSLIINCGGRLVSVYDEDILRFSTHA